MKDIDDEIRYKNAIISGVITFFILLIIVFLASELFATTKEVPYYDTYGYLLNPSNKEELEEAIDNPLKGFREDGSPVDSKKLNTDGYKEDDSLIDIDAIYTELMIYHYTEYPYLEVYNFDIHYNGRTSTLNITENIKCTEKIDKLYDYYSENLKSHFNNKENLYDASKWAILVNQAQYLCKDMKSICANNHKEFKNIVYSIKLYDSRNSKNYYLWVTDDNIIFDKLFNAFY